MITDVLFISTFLVKKKKTFIILNIISIKKKAMFGRHDKNLSNVMIT